MQQAVIIPEQEWLTILNRQTQLENALEELKELMDEDVQGSKAAAKIAGISVRTLEIERERPGTLIETKKVGRSVSYSRSSLMAYKKSKRISPLKLA
jgi:hypothetical protein